MPRVGAEESPSPRRLRITLATALASYAPGNRGSVADTSRCCPHHRRQARTGRRWRLPQVARPEPPLAPVFNPGTGPCGSTASARLPIPNDPYLFGFFVTAQSGYLRPAWGSG
jgi:hypothetical protein